MSRIFREKGQTYCYIYDFGDAGEHHLERAGYIEWLGWALVKSGIQNSAT